MQDRPTAPELLDALAAMLFAEVREWVPRERRFQVLVAANVCAVVARELRAGSDPALADVELFRSLLGASEPAPEPDRAADEARAAARELATALRAGELDDRLDEVAGQLREHVRRKLEIARPGYWERSE
jgi:ABC-type branched-subunit amino acid transport system ATPase component